MTLLEQATQAIKNNRFEEWYISLSVEEEDEFKREIQDAVNTLSDFIDAFIKQMPRTVEFIIDEFNKSIGRMKEALEEINERE